MSAASSLYPPNRLIESISQNSLAACKIDVVITVMAKSKTTIRVALDWTPNTIHSGLFLAQSTNFYSDTGIDVHLLQPDNSYSKTPAKRLEEGEVDLAICPSESVIAYAESGKPDFKLQAIYAILQKDASAIVSRKDGYGRCRDLENAVYGSYNARYEDAIVKHMISHDGGDGSKLSIENATGKYSLFEELKKRNGTIDATWIFLPWEGVEAEMECVALKIFQPTQYGVPYGYSPVIARNAAKSNVGDEAMKKFVEATRKGYELAMKEPEAAVEVMRKQLPGKSEELLTTSQNEINEYYSDESQVGTMKAERWQIWLDWLKERELVVKKDLVAEQLFTNSFLS